jgi:transcriptional regulator with XRE-family HTH domain
LSRIVAYRRQPSENIFGDKEAMPNPDLGRRLLELRQARGLSQGRVAKATGVTTAAIQAYEHGRAGITVERLEDLARALQCEPVELLAPPGTPLPRYRSRRS